MQIDEKTADGLKKQLEGDREKYAALLNQTIGALYIIEYLEKNRSEEISQGELEKMLGGKIEAIEPVARG